MEPKSPSKLKLSGLQWKAISTCIFLTVLICLGIYFAFGPLKTENALQSSYYTVVVDCGSTGTRVNVYEWERRGFGNGELPVLLHSFPDNSTRGSVWKKSCNYHCMQTEPGLHKFVGNASGVRASLEPLIVWAERLVPHNRRRETPIIVLATAGLRKLGEGDATQVLDDVEIVVKEHSFMSRRSWIRVLSGKEEAYYGWVALNYEMGSLNNSSKESVLGLLDLGGSSLQVVVDTDHVTEEKNLILSKFGAIYHQILAYSLPAFGLNEAFDRSVVMLSQVAAAKSSTNDRLEIQHPCLSSDFVENYTCYDCELINITKQKTLGRKMMETQVASTYLVGKPNWEQCKGLVRAVAMNYTGSDWPQQAINTNCGPKLSSNNRGNILNLTAISKKSRHFHALSGFFVVHSMLNLSPTVGSTEIWEKGEELFSRSCIDRTSISEEQSIARQYCFRVPYVASLLEDALCLSDAEIAFGPGDLSWTLGAALVEGEYLWLDATETHGRSSKLGKVVVFSSPIFLFVLLAFLLLIVYWSQIKLPMPRKSGSASAASLPSYVHQKRRPN